MKLSKIALAVAGASIAVSSQAATISGGALAGLDTNESSASAGEGVAAVTMIVPGDVHNAMQLSQGLPAVCIGNRDKVCAPSMSSAEVRGLLNNSYSTTSALTGTAGTVFANLGNSTNYTGTSATKAALLHGRASAGNVDDALTAFVQGGTINGISCGAGAGLEAANGLASDVDDATTFAKIGAGNAKGLAAFIHSTELDDSNQNVGFVKIDGVAPDLINVLSSNYPLLSNLHGTLPSASKLTNGMTVGAGAAGTAVGVAYHQSINSFVACAPLDTGSAVNDVNGGAL